MTSSACFVAQEATDTILLGVTNVCAECYNTLSIGDTIYYDLQSYRYICTPCQEVLCARMNEQCEILEKEIERLF